MSAAESITHLDLDSAIKNNQLAAVFEPYVSLRKLQARGVELHLVWNHPQYGRLAPGLFMPFIFAEGRSRQVTGFMLREAARAASDWRKAGLDWSVSLNLPLEDLADGTLPAMIGVLLDEFDLPPEAFIIDIGEGDLVARSAQALPALTGLRALGCGVALDSAPGEAMIQDLRGLPFTEIKVSGSAIVQFVERTRHSGTGRVAARVYNAMSNGMPVTAVGVDSEAMLWSVQRLDFDAAQGPYICGPSDPISLMRWEKIWCEAAENIRQRKVIERRPLKSEARMAAARQTVPAPRPVEPPPAIAQEAVPLVQEDFIEPAAQESGASADYDAQLEPIFVEDERVGAEAFANAPAAEIEDEIAEPPPAIAQEAEPLVQEDSIEPAAQESGASADYDAQLEPIFVEDERVEVEAFASAPAAEIEDEIAEPPAFLIEEPPADEPEAVEDLAEELVAAVAEPLPAPQASLPPAKPVAQNPEEPQLIARKLPGIAKPIVMTVQNEGSERFKFLKRLGRKG